MNKICVLDCTLRDGGYCNQWDFGQKNIKKIVNSLTDANIDIVECGFLTNRVKSDVDKTKYRYVEDMSHILADKKESSLYCAMVNYGEYTIDDLPNCQEADIQGIRVAFHKRDWVKALELSYLIQEKGYLVFLQPMVSMNYSDLEFLELIQKANQLKPYAFYIVDSFGMMKKKDLMHLFYLVEHNLDENIWIGFHSHNNIQMAYSNAQSLVEAQTNRNLIIDASVFGMGRGAGNLNTELFVEYLNENIGSDYKLRPLLHLIDETISLFYQQNYWGYSLPNYLSAVHNIHPNYALYLDNKKTLTLEDMDKIFALMDIEKGSEFDGKYMDSLYQKFMRNGRIQEERYSALKERIQGKTVLLIAPGKSAADEHEKVVKYATQTDVVAISINFDYSYYQTDFIFISNHRRFLELPFAQRNRCIVTSNIPADGVFLQTDYGKLLNTVLNVQDNAGLMAVKFFMEMGVKKILVAGMDGYAHDMEENYATRDLAIVMKNYVQDVMNVGIQKVLRTYAQLIPMEFVTSEKYIALK